MTTRILFSLVFLMSVGHLFAGGCSDSDPDFIIRPANDPNACVALELENIDSGTRTWQFNPVPIDAATGLPLTPHPYSLAAGVTKVVYWTSPGDIDIKYDGGSWETFHNCNCNPIAADYFVDAPLICNSDYYCGTTSSAYGVDQSGPLECNGGADHEGSLENNSWLKFIADGTTVNFDIDVLGGCYIQFAVYAYNPSASDPDDMFVLMTDINWTDIDNGFTGSNTIVATGLTPGNEYYLHFDGHGGAECDYEIGFNSGFATTGLNASSNLVCPGDAVTLTATPNDPSATYMWSINGGTPFSGGSSMVVNPVSVTTYAVSIVLTGCDQTPESLVVDMDICSGLPVELVSFSAECGTATKLKWETASEYNSDYFELMGGDDPDNLETIYVVDAAGFSTDPISYYFIDTKSDRNQKYYRLKQVDNNGETNYSALISIEGCDEGEQIRSVYNREKNVIDVYFNSDMNSNTMLMLTDLQGRILFQKEFMIQQGQSVISLQLEGSNEYVLLHAENDFTHYTNKHLIK